MTTERQEEAGPVTVQIGVCSACHALFLMSGDRLTSPCHGADPLAILATLTISPDAQVTGEWGLGAPIGEPDITEEPAPAPAPPAEPTAAEPSEAAPETVKASELLPVVIVAFLERDEAVDVDQLKGVFYDAGAEPEAASTAVGRLSAVRELLQQLSAAREPAPVAAAPPEAESSPENT